MLVKEAMANGRLGPRGDGAHRAVIDRVAAAHGVGVDAVAIAAALANPWAGVVLSGAVTPDQVRGNVAALGVDLPPDELGELLAFPEPPQAYWRRRSELAWA